MSLIDLVHFPAKLPNAEHLVGALPVSLRQKFGIILFSPHFDPLGGGSVVIRGRGTAVTNAVIIIILRFFRGIFDL